MNNKADSKATTIKAPAKAGKNNGAVSRVPQKANLAAAATKLRTSLSEKDKKLYDTARSGENTVGGATAYLTRGAHIRCKYGTHGRYLNLPQDHGVYAAGHPVMHEKDCTLGKHITSFGICRSCQNPDRSRITMTAETGGIITGTPCKPVLNTRWLNTIPATQVGEGNTSYNTLSTESFLPCFQGAGLITAVTSGQERAAVVSKQVASNVIPRVADTQITINEETAVPLSATPLSISALQRLNIVTRRSAGASTANNKSLSRISAASAASETDAYSQLEGYVAYFIKQKDFVNALIFGQYLVKDTVTLVTGEKYYHVKELFECIGGGATIEGSQIVAQITDGTDILVVQGTVPSVDVTELGLALGAESYQMGSALVYRYKAGVDSTNNLGEISMYYKCVAKQGYVMPSELLPLFKRVFIIEEDLPQVTVVEETVENQLVSREQLETFFTRAGHFQANAITDALLADCNRVLEKYSINTPERMQMFFATVAHESRNSLVEEGVGNLYVVDGVDYRGGGYTQLTGFDNYAAFAAQMLNEGLVSLNAEGKNPITSIGGGAEYVAEHFPWEAAGWHWTAPGNDINNRIKRGESFYRISQVINGGPGYPYEPNGWDDRQAMYSLAQEIFV